MWIFVTPNQKRQIRELILSLREETAVIISTHILEEVDAVCSRVFLLCKGKTLFDGTKDEFRAKADTLPHPSSRERANSISRATDATRPTGSDAIAAFNCSKRARVS